MSELHLSRSVAFLSRHLSSYQVIRKNKAVAHGGYDSRGRQLTAHGPDPDLQAKLSVPQFLYQIVVTVWTVQYFINPSLHLSVLNTYEKPHCAINVSLLYVAFSALVMNC